MQKISNLNSTTLVAASKNRTPEEILSAMQEGISHFGENYLQEALPKIEALKNEAITWHYIGSIQSKKCKAIAEHFDWVQTVDSLKVAEKLNKAIKEFGNKPLNICIQVNISEEPQKSGVMPAKLEGLIKEVSQLPNLKIRGLMCIPQKSENDAQTRAAFKQMKSLFDALNKKGFELDTLSMGMSADYQIAIEEGSTMIRLGTAIFGPRPNPKRA